MSKKKMAQPLRTLMGLVNLAVKLKVMPDLAKMLDKPESARWETTIPSIFFRKTNPAVETEDLLVDGRVPVRVYKRPGTPEGAPGYLFIHGGGFVDGGVAHCDHVCRELADRSGFVVVGLSYRLAPTNPFPAGLDDCTAVLSWMAKERPGGLDADRLAVGGESAGGNLTVAVALWARDSNGPRIAHHAPIYPLTDFTMSLIPWEEGTPGNPGVTPAVGEAMCTGYLPDGDYKNPMASVLFADHAGLPPALVVTCEFDLLRPEGIALAEAYAAAGVETKHVHVDDVPHGYLLMTRLTPRALETIDAMIDGANQHFA